MPHAFPPTDLQTPIAQEEHKEKSPSIIPLKLTSNKPEEKLKEITDRLEQGILDLFASDRYKNYLATMAKFHHYSVNNVLLITMQKPDASLVAGYTAWKQKFGRQVLKGEKAIKILAPCPYKITKEIEKIDPHTFQPIKGQDGKPLTEKQEITIPAYKVVSVFDVSQTAGRELPSIGVSELTGDVRGFHDFFSALESLSPVPIGFEDIRSRAHGYYHLTEKRIAIDEGLSELQILKTAIHEIAHAKLHAIDPELPKEQQHHPDQNTREVEAESIAYTVCQRYGLDTSDYSFGYIAGWSTSRELAELRHSLETIRSTASEMISSIDTFFAERHQEIALDQEHPTLAGGDIREPLLKEKIPADRATSRPSIRQQLTTEQEKVAAKKTAAKTKKHELEV